MGRSLDGSWWERAKRPQLLFMLETVDELLRSHPDAGARPLQLHDVGGGKGYLAQLIAERFGPERVVASVVELRPRALAQAAARVRRRGGLSNLNLVEGDAAELAASGALAPADVVVALHACGALSDFAVAHAVKSRAAFGASRCERRSGCERGESETVYRHISAKVHPCGASP